MNCCYIFRYYWICTMAAEFMSFINPPAHSMIRMITRIIICASANLTYSVHNN